MPCQLMGKEDTDQQTLPGMAPHLVMSTHIGHGCQARQLLHLQVSRMLVLVIWAFHREGQDHVLDVGSAQMTELCRHQPDDQQRLGRPSQTRCNRCPT